MTHIQAAMLMLPVIPDIALGMERCWAAPQRASTASAGMLAVVSQGRCERLFGNGSVKALAED